MTIEEFGQKIKLKYPQYQSVADAELGQKMIDKYPQYKAVIQDKVPAQATDTFLEGHPILKGISDFVGTTGLGKGIAQGIFLKYTPEGKNLLKLIEQGQLKESDVEQIIGKTATTKEILASAAQTALTATAFGSPAKAGTKGASVVNALQPGKTIVNKGAGQFFKSAGANALKTGGLIGAGNAATAYGQNKSGGEIAAAGAEGFGLGAGFSILGSALKGVISKVPSLLSLTSEVPEGVLQRSAERPSEMAAAGKYVRKVGERDVLKETQQAVPILRKTLSNQWTTGVEGLAQEFGDKRVGFGENAQKTIRKIFDQYGHEVPADLTNLSFKETLELNKTLNAIKQGSLKKSPEGYVVRKLSDFVRERLVNNFGGVGGKVDQFLSDYGARKSVLDSFDILVKAYEQKNPKTMAAALSTLKSVFKENKGAYIDAFAAMEKAIGKPLLDKVASLTTQKILPSKVGGFGFDELIRLALTPITNQRGASFIARQAGRVANGGTGAGATIVKGLLKTTAK